MKPLPVAPPTQEDYLVLGTRVMRGNPEWVYVLYGASMLADRRDAELMRRIERRLTTVRRCPGHYSPADRVVVCVCIDPVFWPPDGPWEIDITYFA